MKKDLESKAKMNNESRPKSKDRCKVHQSPFGAYNSLLTSMKI
jgi:hypothetical protein